jgi:predicted lipoprotein with Yx(FWY)xxD motif
MGGDPRGAADAYAVGGGLIGRVALDFAVDDVQLLAHKVPALPRSCLLHHRRAGREKPSPQSSPPGASSALSQGNQGGFTMKQIFAAVIASAALSLGATFALAQTAEPAKVADSSKGKILVDAKGMTLYTWDRDTTPGKSGCNGNCATNWPPLLVSGDAKDSGNWTVIVRDDGAKQWAYKGKPLYYWKDDKKAGDVEGDNRNNIWHVVAP